MTQPTFTLELGASKNSLTITEGDKVTVFDRSKMTLDERIKLTREFIPLWAKARGLSYQPYRSRRGRKQANG